LKKNVLKKNERHRNRKATKCFKTARLKFDQWAPDRVSDSLKPKLLVGIWEFGRCKPDYSDCDGDFSSLSLHARREFGV
jgi:hypothetical protein